MFFSERLLQGSTKYLSKFRAASRYEADHVLDKSIQSGPVGKPVIEIFLESGMACQ